MNLYFPEKKTIINSKIRVTQRTWKSRKSGVKIEMYGKNIFQQLFFAVWRNWKQSGKGFEEILY